ncbi:MAG: TetR family transcriptional regulator [Cycloclasticus sp.]|nr:TetR family transcriptional regulator [Cycloclasticus sp.]MBG95631.1 TetR family transcriptional regulator [Cycloclasticus sp.]HAI97806.1 TetR/AcrR family transcriptional regulator [Methylococcaceae bacterium]|tara:strand:- start:1524 stop:2138 length:615 start_codon:yes stop_codon:yes gene_type:complete
MTLIQATKKSAVTRQLILDAAAKMLSRHGYHGTYLKDIAASINMQAGSLYYHFNSKEALMQEVLNKSIQLIRDIVEEEVDKLGHKPDFVSLLKAAIRGHLIAILRHADYTLASIRNYGQIPKSVHDFAQADRDAYENFWRELFEQAEKEGVIRSGVNTHLLRLALFGSMNWATIWYADSGTSVEEIAESQADLFLHGCYKEERD